MAREICAREEPALKQVSPGHWSACHFADDLASGAALPRGGAMAELPLHP